MGYPARNYNFNTERETRSVSEGKESKRPFGTTKNASLSKMYGAGKVFGKNLKMGSRKMSGGGKRNG